MTIYKKLQEIQSSKEYQKLQDFDSPEIWTKLNGTDKDLLSRLYIAFGEQLLHQGNPAATEHFHKAAQLTPNDPERLFDMAKVYTQQKSNGRCLQIAADYLRRALDEQPGLLSAWILIGHVHALLGELNQDSEQFQLSQEAFNNCETLFHDASFKERADFFWRWGESWSLAGKLSGEASDFHEALEKYSEAAALGLQDVEFWNDYGTTLFELAILIGRDELLSEVIDLYRNAIQISPDFFKAWLNLACCYAHYYKQMPSDEYFHCASQCFEKAAQLQSNNHQLWLQWGQLLIKAGKVRQDVELLEACNEKFENADTCDPQNAIVLSSWAEAQVLCGAYTEQHELLREAEEKIKRSLELDPHSPKIWCVYGHCLFELGFYFSDQGMFKQAIEKFHYGLSLAPNDPLLLYGLALSYYAIGELTEDASSVEKALRCYQRISNMSCQMSSQFWNDWGVALLKYGEFSNDKSYVEWSLEKFERAISRQDEAQQEAGLDPEWLYNYGCALDCLGDYLEEAVYYERAVQVFVKVLQMDPSFIHAQYNLALALSHLGELTADVESLIKAVEYFQVLLALDSEDEDAWNDWGVALINLAQLLQDPSRHRETQKLLDQAEHNFLHAAALGNTQAYYNLACLYSLIGNNPAALHFIEKAELANALPSLDDILHDDWLEGLRQTQEFRTFITHFTRNRSPES